MLNHYTERKIKNVYTQIPKDEKKEILEFLKISNERKLSFGEPYILGEVLNGSHYMKKYMIKIKSHMFSKKFVLILKYKDEIILEKKFKLSEKEEIIDTIKEFLDNDKYQTIPDKSIFTEEIESYKKYEDGWNGYACNKIDPVSVDNALIYYEKLCEYFPYHKMSIYPSGDSGHVVNQPKDSNSSVYMELHNRKDPYYKRNIEIEFYKDIIYIWGDTKIWNESKYDYDYIQDFPTLPNGDLIQLKSFEEIFEYLYWMDPELKAIFREKYIDEVIG